MPEELADIMELAESPVEARPLELTELIEDVSYDVMNLHDAAKAIQHIDFLMFGVTIYRAKHRAVFAVFELVLIQQIGKYQISIHALNQKSECVSRAITKCVFAIHIAKEVVRHRAQSKPQITMGHGPCKHTRYTTA